ncbi:MAG: DNA recombination protein RmuC [Thermodesulfobacteriota bacterium]
MIELPALLPLLVAVAAGGAAAAAVLLPRLHRHRRLLDEQNGTVAILGERLRNQEQQGADWKRRAEEAELEFRTLLTTLAAERETAGALAEKCQHLEQTEIALQEKSRLLTRLHGENRALATRIERDRLAAEERRQSLLEAKDALASSFKALSGDIFKANSQSFLELAKTALGEAQARASGDFEQRRQAIGALVTPLQQTLTRVDEQLRQMEKERTGAYASVTQQIQAMAEGQALLRGETANLVKALRSPAARGRWGEIQLRRVVEMAGMVEYCDFFEQHSVAAGDGRLRPDMVVRLPGDRSIVVDSKTALAAYLEAVEATDDQERKQLFARHARQVRDHMNRLAGKSYWEQFRPSPEFVVLFLPGENFFGTALEHDPELIEAGVSQRVIPATPTTLIALLRAVSYGWGQEKVAASAQQIAGLGRDLHDRLRLMTEHLLDLRRGIERTIDAYNRSVGTFESRVLVSARRFREMDTTIAREIPAATEITSQPRHHVAAAGCAALGAAAHPADSSRQTADEFPAAGKRG